MNLVFICWNEDRILVLFQEFIKLSFSLSRYFIISRYIDNGRSSSHFPPPPLLTKSRLGWAFAVAWPPQWCLPLRVRCLFVQTWRKTKVVCVIRYPLMGHVATCQSWVRFGYGHMNRTLPHSGVVLWRPEFSPSASLHSRWTVHCHICAVALHRFTFVVCFLLGVTFVCCG